MLKLGLYCRKCRQKEGLSFIYFPKGHFCTSANNTSYCGLKALNLIPVKLNRSFDETNFILHTMRIV